MSDHQDNATPVDTTIGDPTPVDSTSGSVHDGIKTDDTQHAVAPEDAVFTQAEDHHIPVTEASEDGVHHDPSLHEAPISTSTASAHAYASNGLQVLQAASDAAQALQHAQHHLGSHQQDIHDSTAAQAVAAAAAAAAAQASVPGVLPGHPFSPVGDVTRDPTINPKLTRLRRACDMCSSRKVKCDESGPPCKPCEDLNVECTFKRELKRRGPPNKHAEAARAARRARLEPGPGPAAGPMPGTAIAAQGQPFYGAVSPSPHNAAQALVSIAEGPGTRLDAESIAPMPVLELLIDDFFTYIHPLVPFPHEPTFREAFATRQDRTNPEFLTLLAAMIGALVASFPRSVRQHLKAQHSTHLFPRAIVMIDKCRDIALEARGARWAAKQPKTLDDAAASYLLGLACAYTLQYNTYRVFTSECLSLIRELGFHRPKHPGELPTFGNDDCSPDPLPFHHIRDQTGKRIFWCLLVGIRYVRPKIPMDYQ